MKLIATSIISATFCALLACSGAGPDSSPAGLDIESGPSGIHTEATPYATPGPYYNAAGLVGPQANPYYFDPSQGTASLDHCGAWGTTVDANGNVVYGIFSSPVSKRGVLVGCSWQQCGTPGAAC